MLSHEEAWRTLRAQDGRLGMRLQVTPQVGSGTSALLHGAINDESGRELCTEQLMFLLDGPRCLTEARNTVASRLLELWLSQNEPQAARPPVPTAPGPATKTDPVARPALWSELTAMGIDEKHLRLESQDDEVLIVVNAQGSRLFDKELNLLGAQRAGATRTLSVPKPATQERRPS